MFSILLVLVCAKTSYKKLYMYMILSVRLASCNILTVNIVVYEFKCCIVLVLVLVLVLAIVVIGHIPKTQI